jgi:predicted acetyltransferase
MDGLSVRPAREADLEQLAEIHACAYPEPGGHEHHARCLTHNAFGGLDLVRVAEKDGNLLGHAVLFRLGIGLGGGVVPIGGIGSLAVAPEARRRGVASELLGAVHREIASDGGALALLYPFQQRFYARYGYAPVSPLVTLEVTSDAVDTFGSPAGDDFSAVRLQGSRVVEARRLYDEIVERTSGRIVRSESRWLKLFAREHRHWVGVASKGGTLEGYASFSYEARAEEQRLVVHELTAKDPVATRALLSVLGRQRDQVIDIALTVPYGDALLLAFEDAAGRRGKEALGTISVGPMVRIVDLPRALSLRGYAADGDLTFSPTDGSASVRLVVRDGIGQATPGSGSPEIKLSSATLASIVSAGIRPAEAKELGLLEASSASVDAANQMFLGPRFQCLDPF